MNDSLWRSTTHISPRPVYTGDLTAQVAVIGGGLAGVLTAFLLRQNGLDAVVLEAGRLGGGQTQNTTAKVTAQHGLIYEKLTRTMSQKLAKQYADSNQGAVTAYRNLIQAERIDCQWEEKAAYLYTSVDTAPLVQETEAARALGLDAVFTRDTDLPFPVAGAVRMEGQAQVHPLKFLDALAQRLPVYEDTQVLQAEGGILTTNRGTVRAEQVVFATHYPFPLLPGLYFARMHQERSYVLALEGAKQPEGMYLGVDPEGLSLRTSGKLLLLGGGGHRTGENRQGGKFEQLWSQAKKLWPGCREVAHWSAQDCMTLDGVPYIGKFASDQPSWYVATGFGKWGMTSSMVAARILTDLITGKENPYTEVFSPQRFTPAASAKNLLTDGLHAVRDLSREVFAPPRAALAALPPGHGGIVECDGQKTGVYKEADGTLHMVATRCPHLGCQVEWNPDERTWECPCHGSRFDMDGHLIDGPAQYGLSPLSPD